MTHLQNFGKIAALAFAVMAAGCGKQPVAPAPPPTTVSVTKPVQQQVTDWDEYTGHLQSPGDGHSAGARERLHRASAL